VVGTLAQFETTDVGRRAAGGRFITPASTQRCTREPRWRLIATRQRPSHQQALELHRQGDIVDEREAVRVTRSLGSYRATFLPSRLIGTRVAHVPELIGGQSRRRRLRA